MAVWLPAQNKFYLPPQPITRILHTDEYVTRTNVFYHASSERLLTVGHPYFEQRSATTQKVRVPKVSPNQWRVFRVKLPDPNTFAFGDTAIFNPDEERLVWAVRGIEIGRGQPLGTNITGHPFFNRAGDAETSPIPFDPVDEAETDSRHNIAFDPKQMQCFIVGCKPAPGQHWGAAKICAEELDPGEDNPPDNTCPPLELRSTFIQDSDMGDIGFGALDFAELQKNKSDVPLELVNSISKYPDYIKMQNDPVGDSSFFFVRREQCYARHMFAKAGVDGDQPLMSDTLIINNSSNTKRTSQYTAIPSGSLVSTETQVFNKPYWLQRSQGQNNGILWGNQMFITMFDNTRGTCLSINIVKKDQSGTPYKDGNYYEFMRHVEEFELQCILQLCKVKLTPENLAFIHTMNPDIIDDWHLSVQPPSHIVDDKYRYITSLATKCPSDVPTTEKEDPYKDMKFWEVDMTEKLTEQLDQTPLGRKFLWQTGLTQRSRSVASKTILRASRSRRSTSRNAKRRRVN